MSIPAPHRVKVRLNVRVALPDWAAGESEANFELEVRLDVMPRCPVLLNDTTCVLRTQLHKKEKENKNRIQFTSRCNRVPLPATHENPPSSHWTGQPSTTTTASSIDTFSVSSTSISDSSSASDSTLPSDTPASAELSSDFFARGASSSELSELELGSVLRFFGVRRWSSATGAGGASVRVAMGIARGFLEEEVAGLVLPVGRFLETASALSLFCSARYLKASDLDIGLGAGFLSSGSTGWGLNGDFWADLDCRGVLLGVLSVPDDDSFLGVASCSTEGPATSGRALGFSICSVLGVSACEAPLAGFVLVLSFFLDDMSSFGSTEAAFTVSLVLLFTGR
mmetsp:Transcript_13976/g.37348  ORF Transcript_13976/g.37348 Transcript_13976/m.37348 type:complete len:339 (-) Transcript_13976:954-1970(-)